MSLVLIAAAVILLIMPGVTQRWMMVFAPSERAKLGLISLLSGMSALGAALAICSSPVLFHLTGLTSDSFHDTKHFFPGGTFAGWTSLSLLVVLLAVGLHAVLLHLRSHHRLTSEALFAEERNVYGVEVRVLPVEDPMAVAIPGSGGIVVLSRGVIDQLDQNQLHAVIRHEISHLRHHHGWYLLVAALVQRVFGLIPAIARSTDSVRLAVEQWADDDSIVDTGDRRAITSAMRLFTGLPPGPTIAAFAREEVVASRLRHLEEAHAGSSLSVHLLVYLVTAAGLLGALGSLLLWMV